MFLTIRDIFRKKIKVIESEQHFHVLSTSTGTTCANAEDELCPLTLDESLIVARAYHRVPLALDRKTCRAKTEFEGSFSSIRPSITKRLRYRASKASSTTSSAAMPDTETNSNVSVANTRVPWVLREYAVDFDYPNSHSTFRAFDAGVQPSMPVYVEKCDEVYVGGADLESRLCSQPRSAWHEIVRRGLDKPYRGAETWSIKHNYLNKVEQIFDDAEGRWLVRYNSRKERASKNIRSWSYDPIYVEFVNPSDRELWEQNRSYMHDYCDICDYCYEQIALLADYEEADHAKRLYLDSRKGCAVEHRPVVEREAEQIFDAIVEKRARERQQSRIDDCLNDYAKNRPPSPDQYQLSTLTRTWSADRIQSHWQRYRRYRQHRVDRAILMQRMRKLIDKNLWKRKVQHYRQYFRPAYYACAYY
ncbi:hypothetical protein V1525DRAFT_389748 [Lipomyces kononenkoae]|uniref:Uncharacterized protein n=1 Tax=Lipomyces kononenkoae TaxID=34357 RepID=A0ACC3SYE5_LIPKO